MQHKNQLSNQNKQKALDHREKAERYLEEKLYDKALSEYVEAIACDPDFANTHAKLAQLLFYKMRPRDIDQAEIHFVKAKDLFIEQKNFIRISQCFASLAYLYQYRKKFTEAVIYLSEAIKLNPKNAHYFFLRGLFLLKEDSRVESELDLVIEDFNSAINLDPTDSKVYYFRGNCYSKMEEFNKAILDYLKAIEVSAEPNGYYHYALAHVYRKNNLEVDAVIHDLKALILLDKNSDEKAQQIIHTINEQTFPQYTLSITFKAIKQLSKIEQIHWLHQIVNKEKTPLSKRFHERDIFRDGLFFNTTLLTEIKKQYYSLLEEYSNFNMAIKMLGRGFFQGSSPISQLPLEVFKPIVRMIPHELFPGKADKYIKQTFKEVDERIEAAYKKA